MLSRRRFLLGTGALLATGGGVGAIELASHPYERWRLFHKLGLTSSHDYQAPPSGAVQVSGRLASRYMGRAMDWAISTPGRGLQPRAIIFCLHAKGGNHRMAFDAIHVPDMAASVGLPVAVASVDGGVDSYWHKRSDGTDALSMLLLEFVPMVRARVGALPQALMGWSMGGYGALLAAERAAAHFRAVAPAGPALWVTPGATAPGAFDSPADFSANDVFSAVAALSGMTVAVACGMSDPFYPATKHLVSLMSFPHDTFFRPGLHDTALWRSVAPAQLRAIGPALGITPKT